MSDYNTIKNAELFAAPLSNITVGNITVSGNIMPTSNNAGYVGSATMMWHSVHVGPGSLYVNGQQVLSTAPGNLMILSADAGQTISVQTSGTGDIALAPQGTGSILLKGPVNIQGGDNVISSDGNAIQFADPVGVDTVVTHTLNGDLVLGSAANAYGALGGSGIVKTQGNFTANNITSNNSITAVNATFSGNLTVTGNTVYANVATLNIKDPMIEQGGDPAGVPLSSNDGRDRGQLLHYYAGSAAVDAFMGYKNSTGQFEFASNATASNNVVTVNTYGNVKAGWFIGNGSQLTGVVSSSATTAGTVTTAAQPNITSVGTLSSLTVTGTATAGNLSTGGTATVTGNLTAANANLGNLATANYVTGTLTTAAQPNITTVGTLTALALTGKLSANSSNGTTNQVLTSSGNGSTVTWTDIIHPFLLLG